tara:strand:+ start:1676 stop:1870 length:195 start_codon:yes stop_codon:yes gene_type:complete
MKNKFGKYISDLMLMVIENDIDSTEFQLAISELKKLSSDISEFIDKNLTEDSKTTKTLLQENTK